MHLLSLSNSSSTGFGVRYSKVWIPGTLHSSYMILSVNVYIDTYFNGLFWRLNITAYAKHPSQYQLPVGIQYMWDFCFSPFTYSYWFNFFQFASVCFLFLFVFDISSRLDNTFQEDLFK